MQLRGFQVAQIFPFLTLLLVLGQLELQLRHGSNVEEVENAGAERSLSILDTFANQLSKDFAVAARALVACT